MSIGVVDRLTSQSGSSWIACASRKEAQATCSGWDVAEKLITGVHMVVELSPRPLP
ncbi:hypothetical protein [Nocardiopsis ganjiahuensis]|uniref:hypothetical protein n=1 Tax=Nocardiopsis ganjiahuensis TaxID=239984 RepID=UPI0003656CF0|nr:hypothetical protein [Nocardiopsis ganjiahuensis]